MFTVLALRKICKFLFKAMLVFIVLSVLWVLCYRYINPPITSLQLSRESSTGLTMKHHWIHYSAMGDNIKMAVLCGEDQQFKMHNGFDFKAIGKAFTRNAKGNAIRGASTISQQTAKNVFLWEGRSWLRKGMEVWFTLLIEVIWGKERILEVYLNVIEMGPITSKRQTPPVFGCEAASQFYFHKPCKNLSMVQAAKIASILPCPKSCGFGSRFAYSRQKIIIRSIRRWGHQLLP
ncbi:MAG: monofunctional biosynthetic peptidoglycan transglycosylase [Flavobacteriaceae bacterium]|nr:monofunctional biosynthetic peptidoglycan transglycosylase [Flavobacteriaceae bacterium]